MRLLNTTSLEVELFVGQIPQYAILSHRWEDEEVTLEDIRFNKAYISLKGFTKFERAAFVAKRHGFQYIWIDTCCIDKTSSAELSEAINSMFDWYRNSELCIAYLSDITGVQSIGDTKWLLRGWTLQELIAPSQVHFYDAFWEPRGTKQVWADELHERTGIPPDVLSGQSLSTVPVCCKMSWASRRITTRPEDMAYCLLGIFDVSMPLLYGEGGAKAFKRLQEAILSQSDDESIFAWSAGPQEAKNKPHWGLLAPSARFFQDSKDFTIPTFKTWRSEEFVEVSSMGIRLPVTLLPLPDDASGTQFLAVLNCSRQRNRAEAIENAFTIILQRLSEFEHQYARVRPDLIIPLDDRFKESMETAVTSRISVRSSPRPGDPVKGFYVKQQQRVGFDFPTNSPKGLVNLEGFTDILLDNTGDWKLHAMSNAMELYSAEIESPAVEDESLKPRRVDASIKINCVSHIKETEVGSRLGFRLTQMSKQERHRDPYLLVGFERLPDNATRTPHGFTRPWYSFRGPQLGEDGEKLGDDASSDKLVHVAPGSSKISVEFKARTCNFRTFYEVKFVQHAEEHVPHSHGALTRRV